MIYSRYNINIVFPIIFFYFIFLTPVNGQRYNQIKYSLGIGHACVLDKFDNSVIYQGSGFQPLNISVRFANEKWRYQFYLNYFNFKLTPVVSSIQYDYNYITDKAGEFGYEVIRSLSGLKKGFSLYAGTGIYVFESNRNRYSLSIKYPYPDNVSSYDINLGSVQLILAPQVDYKKQSISFKIAAGLVSLVTRPDSYNPLFTSNNGKWLIVSLNKHINLHGILDYSINISERFALNLEYHYFYYRYSFPYTEKVLNQYYLAGLIFKY